MAVVRIWAAIHPDLVTRINLRHAPQRHKKPKSQLEFCDGTVRLSKKPRGVVVADSDVFAFVRSSEEAGCSSDHKKERYLVIANKAQQSKLVVIPESETALEGCTEFRTLMPAEAADPLIREGKLQIEEPAQSMTLYEVR